MFNLHICTMEAHDITRLAPYTWPYLSPCPGQIPIVASTIFPEDYKKYPTRENYVVAVQAGINIGLSDASVPFDNKNPPALDTTSINKILSTAAKTGINILLSTGLLDDNELLTNDNKCKQFLNASIKYPATKGFVVSDEPSYSELESLGQKIRIIQNLLTSFSTSNTLLIVNLGIFS